MTPERVENNIFLVERSTSKADVPSTLQRPQLNTSSTMMMRSLMLLALLLAVSTAFTVPSSRWGVASLTISTTQRNMFSPDPDGDAKPKGLDVVAEGESAAPVVSEAVPVEAPSMIIKNLGRGGEVKEVKFIDPAMSANTNPLDMNWWAYLLFGFPFLLLANDFLHFIPSEGPLSFLLKY